MFIFKSFFLLFATFPKHCFYIFKSDLQFRFIFLYKHLIFPVFPAFTFVKFSLTKVFLFYLEGKLNLYAERGNDMLGEQIKKLRLANDLSQTQLAHALSVTKQSVSNWENDNILPSVDLLKRIALYFSCTTDYLLELEEEGSRILIEVDDLTIQQAAHIQRIIHDFQIVNRQLKNSSP